MVPAKKPPDLPASPPTTSMASTPSYKPKKRAADSPLGKAAKTIASHNSSDTADSTASLPQAQITDSELSDMSSDHEFSNTQDNNSANPTQWTTVKTRKGKFVPLDLSTIPIMTDQRNTDCITVLFRPTQEGSSLHEVGPSKISEELLKVGPLLALRNIRRGGIAADFSLSANPETIMNVSSLCECIVFTHRPGSAGKISGVIKNVHQSENTDNIMSNINANLPEGAKLTHVRRLGRKDQPSKSVKLTFEGSVLPKHVTFSYMSYPVQAYVDKPLICFKCQAYGHTSRSCRGKQACLHCSEEHSSITCPKKASKLCKNCGGPHSTVDPTCPVQHMQKQICTLKTSRNISYASAVRSVRVSYANAGPRPNQASSPKPYMRPSAAATAARKMKDASTSTSDSFIDSSCQTEEVDEKFISRLTAYCIRLAFNGAQNGLSRDRILTDITRGLNTKFRCPVGLDSLRSDIAALSVSPQRL